MPFKEQADLALQLNKFSETIERLTGTTEKLSETLDQKLPRLDEIETATRLIAQSKEAIALNRALLEQLNQSLPNLIAQHLKAGTAQVTMDMTATLQTTNDNWLRLYNRMSFWGTIILGLQTALAILMLVLFSLR